MTASRIRQSRAPRSRLARRRSLVESLESRCLLASLGGDVFLDADGNGLRDPGDNGVPNVPVYLDANDNSQLDAGEQSTTTDGNGSYLFENLSGGDYVVRIVPQGATAQSSPNAFLGTGLLSGTGTDPTDLFQLSTDGQRLIPMGQQTSVQIDGLVRTNDGTLIGSSDRTNAIYEIDPLTGQEQLLNQTGEDLTAGLAYDAETDTIYALTDANGSVSLRTVDKETGALDVVNVGTPVQVLTSGFGSSFFQIDPVTQDVTPVPRQPGTPFASTLDARSDGQVFGLQGNGLVRFDFPPAGSTGTILLSLSQTIASISFDANDNLFGVSTSPSALHRINPATGVVDAGVPITFQGQSITPIQGFDIGPDGTHYVADSTHLYTFDPNTGIATRAPNRAVNGGILTELSVAGDGSVYAVTFGTPPGQDLLELDPQTGLATPLGDNPSGGTYSAVVAQGGDLIPSELSGLGNISGLTFDPENQRIVGFDDANDQFFQFTTQGEGSRLATSDRPLSSSSLAFDGTRFVMFDDGDPVNREAIEADPDSGVTTPAFTSPQSIPAEALFHAKTGNVAIRVTVTDTDIVGGLEFGVIQTTPSTPPPPPPLFINELMLEPTTLLSTGTADTDQYLEIRGPAGGQVPPDTYLVVVDEDDANRGEVNGIFDLSDQPLGANGFLVLLQDNNVYTVDSASAVLESDLPGFDGLPGDIYSSVVPNDARIELGASSFFLIVSSVPPQIGDDIDANDDGLADPTGLRSTWQVLDSVSVHPESAVTSQAYGRILLQDVSPPNNTPIRTDPGVVTLTGLGSGYAARIGDSIGSDADDWVFGRPFEETIDTDTNRATLYELQKATETPNPIAYAGRDLDHLGSSNFDGGVSGIVTLFAGEGQTDSFGNPLPSVPGEGITILADRNGNGTRDTFNFVVDPDDGVDPNNLFLPDGTPVPQVLTNAFPNVTVSAADMNNEILGSDITAEEEFGRFLPLGNRIFGSGGLDTFDSTFRLRFDLYEPASSVSIEALGSNFRFDPTFGRLEAYDANDQLIGFSTSRLLINNQRDVVTVTSSSEDIAYAIAYADDIFSNGSPFGRFDNFAYEISEATGVSDSTGLYEINPLFAGDYEIAVLRDDQSAGLIGGPPRAIQVFQNENFQIDFDLRPNVTPTTEDSFVFPVAENTPAGTLIGEITSDDPDLQQLTFTIESADDFGLLLDPQTGELTVGPNADLDFEADSQYDLVVSVSDPFGETVFTQVTITVLDQNEAPVVTVGDFAVAEDADQGVAIGQVQAFDPDFADDQMLTFSVIGGSGAAAFAVRPSDGLITLQDPAAIDFETVDEVNLVIQVRDDFDPPLATTVTQTIRIVDENDPPVILTSTVDVPENSLGVVGQLLATDPDLLQVHAFELVGGSGAPIFELDSDGTVRVRDGAVVDFETATSYTLDVRAVDNGEPPKAAEATITLNVIDLNEPPMLNRDRVAVVENAPGGTLITTLSAVDPEGVGTGYVIQLRDDANASDFVFDSLTGDLVVAQGATIDFESTPEILLTFDIDDGPGGDVPATATLLVELVDENDRPSLITNRVILSEAADPGSVVGRVEIQVRDPDLLDTATVEIIGGSAADLFDLDANTRVLTVAQGASFDFDAGPDLRLTVEVTDGGGLTGEGEILVQLNDVNEPPFFTGPAPNVAPLVAGEPLSLVIPAGLIVDPEGRDFSIAVFDANRSLPDWLEFDEATRTLSGLPNHLDVGTYALTLRGFEPGPVDLHSDLGFTIEVQQGQTPLLNQRNVLDVDANNDVSSLDALRVVNYMSRFGSGSSVFDHLIEFFGFVDTSGDGIVTARDALLVINGIRANRGSAESVTVSPGGRG